jgi:hypothetical protein
MNWRVIKYGCKRRIAHLHVSIPPDGSALRCAFLPINNAPFAALIQAP